MHSIKFNLPKCLISHSSRLNSIRYFFTQLCILSVSVITYDNLQHYPQHLCVMCAGWAINSLKLSLGHPERLDTDWEIALLSTFAPCAAIAGTSQCKPILISCPFPMPTCLSMVSCTAKIEATCKLEEQHLISRLGILQPDAINIDFPGFCYAPRLSLSLSLPPVLQISPPSLSILRRQLHHINRPFRPMSPCHPIDQQFPPPLVIGDYNLEVEVLAQWSCVKKSSLVYVRTLLSDLNCAVVPHHPRADETVTFEAFARPSSFGIFYTWNFGDGAPAVQGMNATVSHWFKEKGVYNISLLANNTASAMSCHMVVRVEEEITGLLVTMGGLGELGSPTLVHAETSSGTNILWGFDMGDGSSFSNMTSATLSHTYRTEGRYTITVTACNAISSASRLVAVEVHALRVVDIARPGCVAMGNQVSLQAQVIGSGNGTLLRWSFGDGSPPLIVLGSTRAHHTYSTAGNYTVAVTASSPFSTAHRQASVCVQAPISFVRLLAGQQSVLPAEPVRFVAEVVPKEDEWHSYAYRWDLGVPGPLRSGNRELIFSYSQPGVYLVTVHLWNHIDHQSSSCLVAVQEGVGDFMIWHDGPGQQHLSLNVTYRFRLNTTSGTNATFHWDFGDGTAPELGQELFHAYLSSGPYTMTVVGENLVSRVEKNLDIWVVMPVTELSLSTKQLAVQTGKEVEFAATLSAGDRVTYFWAVQMDLSLHQGSSHFTYTFREPGNYVVAVTARNEVSEETGTITVQAEEKIQDLEISSEDLIQGSYLATKEACLLRAHLGLGSNLSYEWAINQGAVTIITGQGSTVLFQPEEAGQYLAVALVKNILGEVQQSKDIFVQEHIHSLEVTIPGQEVDIGQLVHLKAVVTSGTDLQYEWSVEGEADKIGANTSLLSYLPTSAGTKVVTVTVCNKLGGAQSSLMLRIRELVSRINYSLADVAAPSDSATGFVDQGSDVSWEWSLTGERGAQVWHGGRMRCTFRAAGVYLLSLNTSHADSWEVVRHNVMVLDGVEGLVAVPSGQGAVQAQSPLGQDPSQAAVPDRITITFALGVERGSGAQNSLGTGLWLHGASCRVPFPSAGLHDVSTPAPMAWMVEEAAGLHLLPCHRPAVAARRELWLSAGPGHAYTWHFQQPGYPDHRLVGPSVTYTPRGPGLLTVQLQSAGSLALTQRLKVQLPVQAAVLTCHGGPSLLLEGEAAAFHVLVSGGSNVRYRWDFGDGQGTLSSLSTRARHRYGAAGHYIVCAWAFNEVSIVAARLEVSVEQPACPRPSVHLLGPRRPVPRARPCYLEADVELRGCTAYQAHYLWEVFPKASCRGPAHLALPPAGVGKPFLALPRLALPLGTYCLRFTAALGHTSLRGQAAALIQVVPSRLVPIISGGTQRSWASHRDLLLDASQSYDPDSQTDERPHLMYHWHCHSTVRKINFVEHLGSVRRNSMDLPGLNQSFQVKQRFTCETAGGSSTAPAVVSSMSERLDVDWKLALLSTPALSAAIAGISQDQPASPCLPATSCCRSVVTIPAHMLVPGVTYAFTLTVSKPGREEVHTTQMFGDLLLNSSTVLTSSPEKRHWSCINFGCRSAIAVGMKNKVETGGWDKRGGSKGLLDQLLIMSLPDIDKLCLMLNVTLGTFKQGKHPSVKVEVSFQQQLFTLGKIAQNPPPNPFPHRKCLLLRKRLVRGGLMMPSAHDPSPHSPLSLHDPLKAGAAGRSHRGSGSHQGVAGAGCDSLTGPFRPSGPISATQNVAEKWPSSLPIIPHTTGTVLGTTERFQLRGGLWVGEMAIAVPCIYDGWRYSTSRPASIGSGGQHWWCHYINQSQKIWTRYRGWNLYPLHLAIYEGEILLGRTWGISLKKITKLEFPQDPELFLLRSGLDIKDMPDVDMAVCVSVPDVDTAVCMSVSDVDTVVCVSMHNVDTAVCVPMPDVGTAVCVSMPDVGKTVCVPMPDVGTAVCVSIPDVGTAVCVSVPDVGTAVCVSVSDVDTVVCVSVPDVDTAVCVFVPDVDTVECVPSVDWLCPHVLVRAEKIPSVLLECISCRARWSYGVSRSMHVTLAGRCADCSKKVLHKWTVQSSEGYPMILDNKTTSTGDCNADLVIRQGVLHDGVNYTFTLNITDLEEEASGFSSIVLSPNYPPSGGDCTIYPDQTVFLLESPLSFNCTAHLRKRGLPSKTPAAAGRVCKLHTNIRCQDRTQASEAARQWLYRGGWWDEDSSVDQLVYSLVAVTCATVSACERFQLYWGIKPSFSALLPVGLLGGATAVSVIVEVEDLLGARTTAINKVSGKTHCLGTMELLRQADNTVTIRILRQVDYMETMGVLRQNTLTMEVLRQADYTVTMRALRQADYTMTMRILRQADYTMIMGVLRQADYTMIMGVLRQVDYTMIMGVLRQADYTMIMGVLGSADYTVTMGVLRQADYAVIMGVLRQADYTMIMGVLRQGDYTVIMGVLRQADYTVTMRVLRQADYTMIMGVLRQADYTMIMGVLRQVDYTMIMGVLRQADYTMIMGVLGSADYTVTMGVLRQADYAVIMGVLRQADYTMIMGVLRQGDYTVIMGVLRQADYTVTMRVLRQANYTVTMGVLRQADYTVIMGVLRQADYTVIMGVLRQADYTVTMGVLRLCSVCGMNRAMSITIGRSQRNNSSTGIRNCCVIRNIIRQIVNCFYPGPMNHTYWMTLMVLMPDLPLGSHGVIDWLKRKSQSEFWGLVQQGNPDKVIPFAIALIYALNQVLVKLATAMAYSFRFKSLNMANAEIQSSPAGSPPPPSTIPLPPSPQVLCSSVSACTPGVEIRLAEILLQVDLVEVFYNDQEGIKHPERHGEILQDRIAIRSNVTLALASLNVTTLEEVTQISAGLAQCAGASHVTTGAWLEGGRLLIGCPGWDSLNHDPRIISSAPNDCRRHPTFTTIWGPKQSFPVKKHFTCESAERVVYCTQCSPCSFLHIREGWAQIVLLSVFTFSTAITAFPEEFVRGPGLAQSLKMSRKMIDIIGSQTGQGSATPTEAGRNILRVLGAEMTAISFRPCNGNGADGLANSASVFKLTSDLIQFLMRSRVLNEELLSLSVSEIDVQGKRTDPLNLAQDHGHFHIPRVLSHQLSANHELVQVTMSLRVNPFPSGFVSNHSISTHLGSMEFSSPQGHPVPVSGLNAETSIRVTLPGGRMQHWREGTATRTLGPGESANLTVQPANSNCAAALHLSLRVTLLELGGAQDPNPFIYIDVHNDSWFHGTPYRMTTKLALPSDMGNTTAEHTIFLSPEVYDTTRQELSITISSHFSSASVEVSVLVYASLCQYFDFQSLQWRSDGILPTHWTRPEEAVCLTQHLTVFGASLFVYPDAVQFLPPVKGPMQNPIAAITCALAFAVYVVLALIAHKLDYIDINRVGIIPLCGQNGHYKYEVLVKTGWYRNSGTSAHVGISLYGLNKSGSRHLDKEGAFQRNSLDVFQVETDANLGEIWKIRIWHDNTGLDPSWYLEHVAVWDKQTDNLYYFLAQDWLSVENEKNEGMVEKDVLVACPQELRRFSRIFASQLKRGVSERHIWLSVWDRLPRSHFTRVQRVTCCTLLVYLFFATGAAWYGAVGTRSRSLPVAYLANVTGETVAVGIVLAVAVFPIHLFFTSLFRKTRSKVTVENPEPPTKEAQSVEMDVDLGSSELGSSSFTSIPGGPDSIMGGSSESCGGKAGRAVSAMPLQHQRSELG
ncbi:polycystin-1-like [Narcine bancroftii]|uniref:polycystin-1-like n=1 Tax=Narcine bancroftii TaxID=1343680 RepID=UPI0038315360